MSDRKSDDRGTAGGSSDAAATELAQCRAQLKALSCLNAITSLLYSSTRPLEQLMPEALGVVVASFQFPGNACARLTVDGHSYQTPRFRQTPWRLAAPITRENNAIGLIEIFYLEERPVADEGPFQKQERELIDSLAETVARYLQSTRDRDALREGERKYRTLVENLYEGIWIVDAEFNTTFVSARMAELLGYEIGAMRGKKIFAFTAPSAEQSARASLSAEQRGVRSECDVEFLRSDGSSLWTHVIATPLFDNRGGLQETLAAVTEISELKRAERARWESDRRLQIIADGMSALISYVDSDERYRFVNAAYGDWFGRPPSMIVGSRVEELIGKPAYDAVRPYIRRALAGETVRYSAMVPYRTGTRDIDAVYLPDRDEAGKVRGFYALVQDVSELLEYHRVVSELRHTSTVLERVFNNVHVMLAYLDPAFNFIWVNRAYALADNRLPEFYPGKNHFDLFPNPENEVIFRRAMATGEPFTALARPFEYAEHPERGITYWDWTLQPAKDGQGKVEGVILLLTNVTEKVMAMKRLEQAIVDLRRHASMMRRAEDIAQLGYWRFELESGKGHWSEGMYRLFGLAPDRVQDLTQAFNKAVHPDDLAVLMHDLGEARQGTSGAFEREYRIRRADTGEEHVLVGQGEVEFDSSGRPRWLFGITQDVTERKRREWALRERFRLMAEALDDAVRVSKPDMSEVLYVNPAYERIWGRSRNELYSHPSSYFEAIHPADQEQLKDVLCAPKTAQWEAEYRIFRPDGTERWIHERDFPLGEEQGKFNLSVGVARDVTDRKHAEQALYRREQEFEALVERAPDVIARLDRMQRTLYINPAVERLTGRPREWFLGKTPAELELTKHDLAARKKAIRSVFQSGREYVLEHTTVSKTGERYFQSRLVPEFGADGEVVSVLLVERDITDLKLAQQATERLTLQDPLTGIANRRYLEQFIHREWRREARHRHWVSLIMADIDHFKAYNDRYGHQRGDDCLRTVAQVFGEHMRRPTDLLVRYGGEEFAVVLLETDVTTATQLAETVQQAEVAMRLPHDASPVAPVVTVSFGVAACQAHRTTFSDLLNRADHALYLAKAHGRNRIEVASCC